METATSMATTWSQSSKGKGFSSLTTGAKEASASSSTGTTSFKPEDNVFGGKGSGVSTPKQPQNEKESNQKGTTSSKTNKKGSTEGTWLGVDDGSDENVVDDECDEVEDDENDGSFDLVGDPVVPRHDTSHPSASTPLRGSKCTLGHPCEK